MAAMASGLQYDARVDAVVYGATTRDFTRADWRRLAVAALDQASTRETAAMVRELCELIEAMPDGEEV